MTDTFSFIIRTTDECNFNCSYCGIPKDAHRKMNNEVLFNLINKAIRSGKRKIFFIWHGGEPLSVGLDFYERAVNIQTEIQKSSPIIQIKNWLHTNGTLLTEDYCKFFAKYHFNISVSSDGPQKLHDKQRQYKNGKSTFNDVMKGIQLLHHCNFHPGVIAVLGKESLGFAKEIVDFFLSNNISYVSFNLQYKFFEENDFKTINSFNKFLIESHKYILGKNLPIQVRQIEWAKRSFTNKWELAIQCSHLATPCIYNYFGIDVNGNIFPGCTRIIDIFENGTPKFLIGNVITDDFKSAQNSLSFRRIEGIVRQHRLRCASTCDDFKYCYGGCTSQIIQTKETGFFSGYCANVKSMLNIVRIYK